MSPPPPQEPISYPTTADTIHLTTDKHVDDYNDSFHLTDLIDSIHTLLGDEGLDSERIDSQKIIQLMERYSSNASDWSKYTLFDSTRAYTRNLIDDGNGKFNLMILAWSEGQQSPIHDHPNSHCIMKILDGELQETLFDWPSSVEPCDETVVDITQDLNNNKTTTIKCNNQQPLVVARNTIYQPNQVTYVHDKIGLHRISNPSKERGAVSLHLYTPPYKMCKTFEEKTGRARSSGICSFYSIGGNRI
ncbi:MAG: RmlC-like cupin domain-containing protein [Benjaminiella poitrasii]|nr:MAG: RmlC-like cupin domain-containing protein [Benjaminiella poitrasii]